MPRFNLGDQITGDLKIALRTLAVTALRGWIVHACEVGNPTWEGRFPKESVRSGEP